jgi:hypothetical protein
MLTWGVTGSNRELGGAWDVWQSRDEASEKQEISKKAVRSFMARLDRDLSQIYGHKSEPPIITWEQGKRGDETKMRWG